MDQPTQGECSSCRPSVRLPVFGHCARDHATVAFAASFAFSARHAFSDTERRKPNWQGPYLFQSGLTPVILSLKPGRGSAHKRRLMAKIKQGCGVLALACALGATGIAPAQAQSASEIVLQNFGALPRGAIPYAGVIRDSAGNLYGITFSGGTAGAGVVYKLDAAGRQTVLYSFTGGADGANPNAGVIGDPEGDLYGTTPYGGTANQACPSGCGVVYKLDTTGRQTGLYSFPGGADGANPNAGVIRDPAGSLYGTAYHSGTTGWGVVFKLDTTGQYTVLYTFTGGADGGGPETSVIRDSAGNLYGTTCCGGTAGEGVVYKLDVAGRETVLHTFTGGADGGTPESGVIRDSAGNLYGTTQDGGTSNWGIVYKLD